ncbi:MAG: hypothetical protein K8823_1636 [Cenarchaeum symbiont of Oopsacas minuta]|nr:hypothetical protein [Cenarchaeum symbiont of Oopsacas minuta]
MRQSMQDTVERWLIHGSYRFKQKKMDGSLFCNVILHLGGFGNPVHIFESIDQPGIIIIGSMISLKNRQNSIYLKLNKHEQEKFRVRIIDFCYNMQAVHKFHTEDGRMIIGAYVILDKKDQINEDSFLAAIHNTVNMGDKLSQFLTKTI